MAYTQAQIDALQNAVATGSKRVKYPDGSEVEYRELAEIERILAAAQATVNPTTRVRQFRSLSGKGT